MLSSNPKTRAFPAKLVGNIIEVVENAKAKNPVLGKEMKCEQGQKWFAYRYWFCPSMQRAQESPFAASQTSQTWRAPASLTPCQSGQTRPLRSRHCRPSQSPFQSLSWFQGKACLALGPHFPTVWPHYLCTVVRSPDPTLWMPSADNLQGMLPTANQRVSVRRRPWSWPLTHPHTWPSAGHKAALGTI